MRILKIKGPISKKKELNVHRFLSKSGYNAKSLLNSMQIKKKTFLTLPKKNDKIVCANNYCRKHFD